jgi:type II secretion system protein H
LVIMRLAKPSENSLRARRGFTLMEMMVVLVLIAILTAMIIPEMKGTFEDALLRSTGRELVNVIELASSRAISLNQTLRLQLDSASGRYEIDRRSREVTTEDFVPLKDVAGSKGQLDKRISVQIFESSGDSADAAGMEMPAANPEAGLVFYPDGTADGATVLLKDRAGFRLELRVSAITSRVTILEPTRK